MPPKLERVCLRCLEKSPEGRFATADQLARELRSCLRGGSAPVRLLGVLVSLTAVAAAAIWLCSGRPTPADNTPSLNEPTRTVRGMYFDGQTRVVTPLPRFAPCTLEAWVRPESDKSNGAFIGSDVTGEFGLSLATKGGRLYAEFLSGSTPLTAKVPAGVWSHVAVVFGTDMTTLYLNGKPVHEGTPTAIFGDAPFVVGGLSFGSREYQFEGHVRSVRISQGRRYSVEFVPEQEFAADDSAALIYDFERVTGRHVEDLSGHGNHGRLEASSVSKPSPPLKHHTLKFVGEAMVVTPVERFAPCTIEAWALPLDTGDGCRFVVGSDIEGEYGIGLAVCGGRLGYEYLAGLEVSKMKVPVGRWSHLAAVFGREETRLYLNGRHVWTGPATRIKGGTEFVVGGLGAGISDDQFIGQIRCVRLSRGERYSEAFVPDQVFAPDEQTMLLYEGRSVDGLRVIDTSGNGYDGRWVRVGR